MRTLLSLLTLATVLAFGAGSAPEQSPAPDPDVRLVYESDARAYYRPCG
jgi:hypothetical protein